MSMPGWPLIKKGLEVAMERPDSVCAVCREPKVFTACLGCGKPVCERCARFELIGSGCGCVWPAYYCPACVQDPAINPNASLREPEPSEQT